MQNDHFVVSTPVRQDVTLERAYVADVRAVHHAEIRARYPGVIESVAVDEGQAVKAGQLLFSINARVRARDVEVARAASAGATAALQAAQLDVDNTRLLQEKNIVSDAELSRARANAAMQRARLGETRASLSRAADLAAQSKLRAPFDGTINRIPLRAGSMIDGETLLTTISDSREVLAYFAVSEREYLDYAKATKPDEVRLSLADGSMFDQTGTIDAVGSEFDANTGTITYRARFPNPQGTLKHGSSAKVVLRTKLLSALVIPQRSTFEIQGNVYVYAVDGDGIARARQLTIKTRVGDLYVVEKGLALTDRYVVEGAQKLKDGVRVEAVVSTQATGS
jgi:membrane fusion protein (multidrug efflux system)